MITLETYRDRIHLLNILSKKNIEYACEVGVQAGDYSKEILSRMPSIKKLYLVDLWKHQENYIDSANVSDEEFDKLFLLTKTNINPWINKVEFLKGYSNEMHNYIPDNSLDWIYIDARHDYLGCKEDINLYWPKLKTNGIMSGHDYLESYEVSGQDWSICYDGSIHPGAVKGAVDEFAIKNNLQVLVSYKDYSWHTWSIIKQEKS